MSISVNKFGEYKGKDVHSVTLSNNTGMSAEILTYGGIIKSLVFNGTDIVLGRDTLEEYIDNDGYLGALIGRNSNRIKEGLFTLNGVGYKLYKNEEHTSLHGGKEGFNTKVWDWDVTDGDEPKLKLSILSPDMEENYPGNLKVDVTYTLTKDNAISIDYYAVCDKDTIVNMTNHAYFNLNGDTSGAIDNQTLMLNCDFYTPNCEDCYPTGEVLSVENTAFDFRKPKKFADAFNAHDSQIALVGGGIDHNFAINSCGMRKFCEAMGDKTGIVMEGFTDQLGIQLYTGNFLEGKRLGKGGYSYKKHDGFCLETQGFPNAINYSHFPSPVLKCGEEYKTKTVYKFSIK